MNRIFFPLYFILFSFILFISPINEAILGLFFQQQWEEDISADYKGFYVVLEKLLEKLPENEWDELTNQASENSNIPIKILPLDSLNLTNSIKEKIKNGQIVVADTDVDIIYKQLTNTSYVIKTGPVKTNDDLVYANLIAFAATFLVLFILVLAWAINLQRKMGKLNQVTHLFSQGDYTVRTSEKWNQQVGSLNQAFNHMANQIQKHIEGQKELTNAVAHELRTPIACLRFELAELVEEDESTNQQSCIEGMAEDIEKIDKLVDELLTFARFDYLALPSDLPKQDINHWLKELVNHFKYPSEAIISFVDKGQSYVLAFDSFYMQRAITNLLTNALRYAKNTVSVSVECINNQEIIIHIDDDGNGVAAADRINLFSPFVRADKSRSRKTGGFGLGLAIVQKIINWHGGKVAIHDSPLGGASFRIYLPLPIY